MVKASLPVQCRSACHSDSPAASWDATPASWNAPCAILYTNTVPSVRAVHGPGGDSVVLFQTARVWVFLSQRAGGLPLLQHRPGPHYDQAAPANPIRAGRPTAGYYLEPTALMRRLRLDRQFHAGTTDLSIRLVPAWTRIRRWPRHRLNPRGDFPQPSRTHWLFRPEQVGQRSAGGRRQTLATQWNCFRALPSHLHAGWTPGLKISPDEAVRQTRGALRHPGPVCRRPGAGIRQPYFWLMVRERSIPADCYSGALGFLADGGGCITC